MAVRHDEPDDLVQSSAKVLEVGKDQVDARLRLLGKQNAAVHDQDLVVGLEDRHVAPDLPDPAQRNNAQTPGRQVGQLVSH